MQARLMKSYRSCGLSSLRSNAVDHFLSGREIAGCHVTRREQVAEKGGDITGKKALSELTDHRVLDLGFSDERAIDELTVFRSSGENPASLQPRDNRRNSRLRQLSLGVQLLPDLRSGQLTVFPQQAKDGDLQFGQRLAIRHLIPQCFYTCRFYTCRNECQGRKVSGRDRTPGAEGGSGTWQ